jgi:Zn-dependent protease with chaperone function
MVDRVHPNERRYFVIVAVVSVLLYLMLILSVIGLIYILIGALVGLFVNGLFTGHFRGNSVRVSEHQFPDIHGVIVRLAREVGIEAPTAYVLQAGGALNAFALRFLGRNYVVLYSDVVELARQQGEEALAFVIAHELAHHQRGHTGWKRVLTLPGAFIPFLGSAYSRACEYTCDAYGADASPEGAVDGLLVLAAGKQLYRDIDARAFARQADQEEGFWVAFAELVASHPNLPKRVSAVQARIASRKAVSGATVQGVFAGA